MPRLTVTVAEDADEHEWNGFLETVADTNLAQDFRWRRLIQETFGHRPRYLVAREAGMVRGVLPLFHVRSRLFGASLISVPYVNAGGVAAAGPAAVAALLGRAEAMARGLGVAYQEVRTRAPQPHLQNGWVVREHKVTRCVPVEENAERVFLAFDGKLKNRIRKGQRAGADVEIIPGDQVSASHVAAFHSVFARNMRDLGTPTYPLRLFADALSGFGTDAALALVHLGGRPVVGCIVFRHKRTAEILWGCADRSIRALNLNSWTYWQLLNWASESGLEMLDLGRCTRGSSVHRFKQQWPGQDVQLHWYYDLIQGEMPDVSSSNGRFWARMRAWRRLPLVVTKVLGPLITRHLP